jgi:hypothetical protein
MTRLRVPGGGELGLYEPAHPPPLGTPARTVRAAISIEASSSP